MLHERSPTSTSFRPRQRILKSFFISKCLANGVFASSPRLPNGKNYVTAEFIYEIVIFNSQVSSWFCRTNEPLIYTCQGLNVVVSQKFWDSLQNFVSDLLVISAQTGSEIFKVQVTGHGNRKYSFSSENEGLMV